MTENSNSCLARNHSQQIISFSRSLNCKIQDLYLDETRVISESRDSAGLNDIGGGGFGSNTKSTRFNWSEFFLLFR